MKRGILEEFGITISTEETEVDNTWGSDNDEPVGELVDEVSPSDTLFNALHQVSNEALMMGNISKFFDRKVTSLTVAIQEGFKYLTTYNYNPMETLHPNEVANFTSTLEFFDHVDLKVPQPNGLKSEYLPLTAMLVEHAKVMQLILNDVIRPATTRFGHYLSVPFDRAERRDFEYGIRIAHDREELVKNEANFFSGGRTVQTTLGKAFNSFSDLVTAERNMQTVNGLLAGGSTDEVKKAVQSLIQTASALIRRISEERTVTTSNELAKMISDQLTEVGHWVEWYAAQMTRIIETNNALYEVEKTVLAI